MITVSIVSHGHGTMVVRLCEQILRSALVSHLIVTLNTSEQLALPEDTRLQIIKNTEQKGFGANHNFAFKYCETDWYCVVNPDIELPDDPFQKLASVFNQPNIAVIGPMVLNDSGQVEDSWRRFPSPVSLILKALTGNKGTYSNLPRHGIFKPDWVAGMFMLFKAKSYSAVQGFDERFFLYYEDVDICARLRSEKLEVYGCIDARVVHKAQRLSWSSWHYRRHHMVSMVRYFSRSWRRAFPIVMRTSKKESDYF